MDEGRRVAVCYFTGPFPIASSEIQNILSIIRNRASEERILLVGIQEQKRDVLFLLGFKLKLAISIPPCTQVVTTER